VSPWTPVAEVRDLTGMVTLAQRLMASNRSVATQATTGSRRRGEEHWVFERTGLPCRRCRTPIARAEQGLLPGERITYWCPRYQPGSRPPG
jgi:endonuclease-8